MAAAAAALAAAAAASAKILDTHAVVYARRKRLCKHRMTLALHLASWLRVRYMSCDSHVCLVTHMCAACIHTTPLTVSLHMHASCHTKRCCILQDSRDAVLHQPAGLCGSRCVQLHRISNKHGMRMAQCSNPTCRPVMQEHRRANHSISFFKSYWA
jgi:hypothetical protein